MLSITVPNNTVLLSGETSNPNLLVQGILDNDPATIKMIYRNDYRSIRSMVRNFRVPNLEPEDVFQEGLTRAILNIRNGRFNGDSSFSTYLYSICRNICLKEYKKVRPITSVEIADEAEEAEENHFEKLRLVVELKDKLNSKCKEIIDLRFSLNGNNEDDRSNRFEAIASKLGLKADNARQRFKRCMARLQELVMNNPQYQELFA